MRTVTVHGFAARLLAALGLALLVFGWPALGLYAQDAIPTLAEADKLYVEKSYAAALEGYLKLLEAKRVPAARQDEVEYRVVVSLGKTEKWDRALEAGLEFVKARRGTVWEPRGLYWLGRLYLGVPHHGWRVGEAVHRGADVPRGGGAAAEQVYLHQQDSRNAVDALEAARVLYPRFREAHRTGEEEIQLDFDLARQLPQDPSYYAWIQGQDWAPPADPQWKVDPAQDYSLEWLAPKKVLYLYRHARWLADRQDRPHSGAIALLGEAVWLQQYHQMMQSNARRYDGKKWVQIPYPYQDVKPTAPLEELVRQYPQDSLRDQAQFTLGMFREAEGEYKQAVAEYRKLIRELPQSKWTEDAKLRLQELLLRRINLTTAEPPAPGSAPVVTVGTRNAGQVHLELFKVELERPLTQPARLSDPETTFENFGRNFGELKTADRWYGPPVARWDVKTDDKGDYRWVNRKVTLPVKATGAYVLEATVPGARAATVVLVTDLVVVEKLERDRALFFATNRATGKPVANAEIVAKQWWSDNERHADSVRGKTDGNGLFSMPLRRAPNRRGFSVQALAWTGERYAVTQMLQSWWDHDNPEIYRTYSITDRAVYRPGQTVHYRQVAMRRVNGEWRPAAGQQLQVVVQDNTGSRMHELSETMNQFGSVSGSFTIPASARLGEYVIGATIPNISEQVQNYGGNRFRVEEYKKPEVEVTVKPTSDRVRLGETAAARIHAEYYFGGPVPNAKVTYRVYRNPHWVSYRFPRPFDFLYPYYGNGDYNLYYRNGEVVSQGEARTDAQGNAEISIKTEAPANQANSDFRYTIEAEVQDASRRVITGSGSVTATRQDVYAFLNFPHGYASKGDLLRVEVATIDPSETPVSVAGTAKVFRMREQEKGEERLVHQEPLTTDKEGRGYLEWRAEEGGHYEIRFETRDRAGQQVAGRTQVWVAGPELDAGRFLLQNVYLQVKELYYEQGQTAKVLLVTPEPDCTVLLTREANNQITEQRVVRVKGRSVELELPVTRNDVPNVYVTAMMVRDGRVHQSLTELFVPPVRELLKVAVQADREQYEPGQKARLQVKATDWQGRPVRAELALAVTDASLSYIQKDYAPDIRTYHYGERRSDAVPEGSSAGTVFYPGMEDTQPRGSFRTHEWLLPEGMGQVPDWPGPDRAGYYWHQRSVLGQIQNMAYYRDGDSMLGARGPAGPPGAFGGMGGFGGGMAAGRMMSAPAAPGMAMKAEAASRPNASPAPELPDGGLAEASLRTRLADTALWVPTLTTDAQGNATAEVVWPDNLTQWRLKSIGNTTSAQVGTDETSVRTKKDLLVRLQAPRFFVERDEVVVSGNIHNYLPQAQRVRVRLDLRDDTASMAPQGSAEPESWIEVPSGGEKRLDWRLRVAREGNLRIRLTAQTQTAADATELAFPVLVHGVERQLARSGVLRGERGGTASLPIALPRERKPGSSELVVQLNPSLAATMLDALPYLVEYPYGCIEQTVSRFIPAVLVRKTLADLGYDLEALEKRARELEEKARAGDAARPGGATVENSPYTYPKGRPGTIRVREMARYLRTAGSPVFNGAELQRLIGEGLDRIQGAQQHDGGWGWWPGQTSDPYMSSYVLYGLQVAKSAGVPVDPGVLERGMQFLAQRFPEEDNFHLLTYEARVLSMEPRYREAIRPITTGRLWENRERLTPYSRALLALALHGLGEQEKAEVMLRNLETTAKIDRENGTANWDQGRGGDWWRWYHNQVETNATVLQAYMAVRPDAELPPLMVKWLVNNRRGNFWHSTRETAWAVYALADYIRVNKELAPEYTVTVDLGGKIRREYTVTRENALFFDNQFVVPDELLETGEQPLTIRKDGPGALYFSAYTTYFSLEEPLRATGNEISVRRQYFRLVPGTAGGQPEAKPLDPKRPNPFLTGRYELLDDGGEWTGYRDVNLGPRYERVPLEDGATVTSGDLLEVELQLESKNEYDYLVFEDLKPSGCEAAEVRSGYRWEKGVGAYVEFRDTKVAFFLDRIRQGTSTLTYRLRAEVPGRFHTLPTNGYAMYAPDIRTLSDEMGLSIRDAE
ncbi:MAG: alpha-2-macroglobulin family protein [Armatimonadota bacterium]